MSAPRITAGYDAEEARIHVFPTADGPVQNRGDPAAASAALAAALTRICGLEGSAAPLEEEAARLDWQVRGDGSRLGLAGGATLATALLSSQCGGEFDCRRPGCSDASVERARVRLLDELRGLLHALQGNLAPHAFEVSVGGVRDRVDLALAEPAAMPDDAGRELWRSRLRAALDALTVPVRLVLHEAPLAVRAVRTLAVGDVLPLATAHEVGVRVGTLPLARGHITDAESSSPRVVIVARGSRPLQETH